MGLDRRAVDPAQCRFRRQVRSKSLAGDAGSGGKLHAAADGTQQLDRINDGWGADVGGGGE